LEDYNQHTWDTGASRDVFVDPNEFAPDGSPNPHFGDFYTQGNAQWQHTNDNRENWRATVSYEFDFGEKTDGWVSKLGRHRLASLVSNDKFQNKGQQGMRYRWLPDVNGNDVDFGEFQSRFASPDSNNNWATDGTRQLNVRHYLTPANEYKASQADNLILDGRPIQLQDFGGNVIDLPALEIPYFDANGRRLVANNAAQGISNNLDTLQFAYQGYFWNNRVVVTYGWREDEASSKTFDVSESARNSGRVDGEWRGVYDSAGNQLPFARPTGLWPYYNDLELKVPGDVQKGITRTKGVVFHATENISLHYNESDTFQPNIGRFDPYANEYPGAEGDGKDYGFTLTLFENRLSVRYNEFETLGGPQRAANTPFNRWRDPIWNVESRWRDLVEDPTYPAQGEGGFREKGRCCYWVMSDKFSEGREVTISANPIDNLNVRFTWTERDAIESNIGKVWETYRLERLAVWQTLNVPEGGENNPEDLNGDGEIGTWTWDTAWRNNDNPEEGSGQTLSEYYESDVLGGSIGWNLISSLDGKANEFDRTGRWNLNASYRIREGKLSGLTYGGALRWREAPVIGYGITGSPDDPASVVDLTDPRFGAEDFTTDVFASYRGKTNLFGERNYKVQLNVRNLLDEDDNVPGIKDINGNNIRMLRKFGRQFILSVQLDI